MHEQSVLTFQRHILTLERRIFQMPVNTFDHIFFLSRVALIKFLSNNYIIKLLRPSMKFLYPSVIEPQRSMCRIHN